MVTVRAVKQTKYILSLKIKFKKSVVIQIDRQ